MTQKQKFALLRILFGIIWAIDAYFKWQPQFFRDFTGYLNSDLQNQPPPVRAWIDFWIRIVGVDPHLFALLVAVIETIIAIDLLLCIIGRLTLYGGILFSLVIWSTAEGFGGPYQAGSTDIGAAIIYALVFVSLLLGKSWEAFSIKSYLKSGKTRLN